MSKEPLALPQGPQLTQQQLEAISGGSCTAQDFVEISEQLRTAYDNLVDFTSYVIERVIDSTAPAK